MIMPVYLGPTSCYAKNEGIYVKPQGGKGVDKLREAAGILVLIERDLRRGWTYDSDTCKKIRMTYALAIRRANFLILLARRFGMPTRYLRKLERWVTYFLSHRRLPPEARELGKKAIVKVRKRRK